MGNLTGLSAILTASAVAVLTVQLLKDKCEMVENYTEDLTDDLDNVTLYTEDDNEDNDVENDNSLVSLQNPTSLGSLLDDNLGMGLLNDNNPLLPFSSTLDSNSFGQEVSPSVSLEDALTTEPLLMFPTISTSRRNMNKDLRNEYPIDYNPNTQMVTPFLASSMSSSDRVRNNNLFCD